MATHAHGTQTYSHLDPSVLPIPRVSIERVEGDIELIQGERDLEDKDERKLNDYLRGKTIWDLVSEASNRTDVV
ncbi:uncharacterized protein JCM6883_006115 [Sporobolomyces salmoneus]|uniref:uncharacterized protein n=1 Tax=Sporobolomyces salmoneus TaxID=183962 RepID=UPI00317ADAF2